jgi:hypothetical protein
MLDVTIIMKLSPQKTHVKRRNLKHEIWKCLSGPNSTARHQKTTGPAQPGPTRSCFGFFFRSCCSKTLNPLNLNLVALSLIAALVPWWAWRSLDFSVPSCQLPVASCQLPAPSKQPASKAEQATQIKKNGLGLPGRAVSASASAAHPPRRRPPGAPSPPLQTRRICPYMYIILDHNIISFHFFCALMCALHCR